MATLAAISAAAALAGAGAGVYGAMQSGSSQGAGNSLNASTLAENRRQQTTNTLIDLLNNYRNIRQQALDNTRYDEAVNREDAQRQFVNRLSTASQRDADGNILEYDAASGTWRVRREGVAATQADRRRTLDAADYDRSLVSRFVDQANTRDRLNEGARSQGTERALGAELLNRYRQTQGRSPESMQGALIEKNVAEAMDPLQRGGEMAMLAGYRQGNSGNDALMGALARQGTGATRSAIANARFAAPSDSLNERDLATKSILSPATSLNTRGSADPGAPTTAISSDTGGNLLAALAKVNPAGVGTTLSPRAGQQAQLRQSPGSLQAYTPLNAEGNQWAGVSASLSSLLKNKDIRSTAGRLFGGGEETVKAPVAVPPQMAAWDTWG